MKFKKFTPYSDKNEVKRRDAYAYELRKRGKTYKAIANELDISAARARQIIFRHHRIILRDNTALPPF